MLETLDDPTAVIAELRRITKHGGVVGAASVEYDGIILAGEQTAGPRRFYISANSYGGQLGQPSRIRDGDCAGSFRRRGSAMSKPSLTISAMGRRIGSALSPPIEQLNVGIASCMPPSLAMGSPRRRSCLIWRQPGRSGATTPPPSLPSPGVGCWPGARNTRRARPKGRRQCHAPRRPIAPGSGSP
jgi:hypothetical protein